MGGLCGHNTMRKDLTSLTSHLGWIRSSHMNVNTCECVYIYVCVCVGCGGQLALSLCESGCRANTGQSGGCPWWQRWREDAKTNTDTHTQHQGEHGLAVGHWVRKSVLSHAVSITGRRDKTQNYRRTTACSLPGAPEPAQKPQTHSEVVVFCFSFIFCQISAVPVVNVHIKHDQSFWYWAQCTVISASPELSQIYILRLSQLFLL